MSQAKNRYDREVLISDRDIRSLIDSGDIVIDPFDPSDVQPASVDVRLDRYFQLFDNHKYALIDPATQQPGLTHLIDVGNEPFILHPGEFVLGSTFEHLTLPAHVAARLEGKSSLGRLGLLTHSTAGFIDPGFTGHITLELSNTATMPIALYPGMKIGQLCFFRMSSPAQAPYGSGAQGSRYQGQRGPTASRSYLNFSRVEVCAGRGIVPENSPLEDGSGHPGEVGVSAGVEEGAAQRLGVCGK